MTEEEMFGWHHQLDGHEFDKLWELMMTGRPGVLLSME